MKSCIYMCCVSVSLVRYHDCWRAPRHQDTRQHLSRLNQASDSSAKPAGPDTDWDTDIQAFKIRSDLPQGHEGKDITVN